jgi:hypothetical protein
MRAIYRPVTRHFDYGAVGENRTPDLMITNQLLYLLSYNSETGVD